MIPIEHTKLFVRKILIVVISVFVFSVCLGKQVVTEESDGDVVVISPQCMMAIYSSLDDLYSHYSSIDLSRHKNFKEYFEKNLGSAECFDHGEEISISFFPPLSQKITRGGGVIYLINKKDYSIVERIFGR